MDVQLFEGLYGIGGLPRLENLLLKEFSKKYLIFLDFRAIVVNGSILVEQRVDESPLFLVGFQQERVCFAWMRSSRNGSLSFGHRSRARILRAEFDSMVSNKKEYAPLGCAARGTVDSPSDTARARVLHAELDYNQQERVSIWQREMFMSRRPRLCSCRLWSGPASSWWMWSM